MALFLVPKTIVTQIILVSLNFHYLQFLQVQICLLGKLVQRKCCYHSRLWSFLVSSFKQ